MSLQLLVYAAAVLLPLSYGTATSTSTNHLISPGDIDPLLGSHLSELVRDPCWDVSSQQKLNHCLQQPNEVLVESFLYQVQEVVQIVMGLSATEPLKRIHSVDDFRHALNSNPIGQVHEIRAIWNHPLFAAHIAMELNAELPRWKALYEDWSTKIKREIQDLEYNLGRFQRKPQFQSLMCRVREDATVCYFSSMFVAIATQSVHATGWISQTTANAVYGTTMAAFGSLLAHIAQHRQDYSSAFDLFFRPRFVHEHSTALVKEIMKGLRLLDDKTADITDNLHFLQRFLDDADAATTQTFQDILQTIDWDAKKFRVMSKLPQQFCDLRLPKYDNVWFARNFVSLHCKVAYGAVKDLFCAARRKITKSSDPMQVPVWYTTTDSVANGIREVITSLQQTAARVEKIRVMMTEAKQVHDHLVETVKKCQLRTYSKNDVLKYEEESCNICFEEWKEGDSVRKLPCKHEFHEDCIEEWLKYQDLCVKCYARANTIKMTTQ